jgi:hypothetical protein
MTGAQEADLAGRDHEHISLTKFESRATTRCS